MYQVTHLHKAFDLLQKKYGDRNLKSVYGAGCINNPKYMFVFMNPTARNISSKADWDGLRAPWIGTKQVWRLFKELNFLNKDLFIKIQSLKPNEWNIQLALEIYNDIKNNSIYVTNLAKCTQIDARPLKNSFFKPYIPLLFEEISFIKPKYIITFGNQVSSLILSKSIRVSEYFRGKNELININNFSYKLYPCYYPVGQGRRNMPKTLQRLSAIL